MVHSYHYVKHKHSQHAQLYVQLLWSNGTLWTYTKICPQ